MAELNIFHYIPQKSPVHNMDARIKLICMILLTVSAGIASKTVDLSILTCILFIALIVSRLPIKNLLLEIRYFLFLIGFVIVVNSYSVPGTPITSIPIHGFTWEGLNFGLRYGWRLILIFLMCTVLTGTTPLFLLKSVIEWFLAPIPWVPEARVATMFSLTFVLIPLVFDQASEMQEAQKARCIEARKNPIRRVMSLIFPLLLHTFMRADEMVLAMESRCYSEVRTKAVFKTSTMDWLILIFSGLIFSMIVFHRF
ncbi:energy-coupling factor transporter transmembrane component T family protein [Desulfitobacterium sp. AusDCA]|uniref:energy-coupling factor transporter transmembrane component T family protein n=1 Tax=Desulfitobacterium sp. AusDCA TaxID=3240383 RepID=UPI003DA79F46